LSARRNGTSVVGSGELPQELVGLVGLARLRQETGVEAERLAVPRVRGEDLVERLPRVGEAPGPEDEGGVLDLQPEVRRVHLEVVLNEGDRLVPLTPSLVDPEEAEGRRVVLRVHPENRLEDVLCVPEPAALLQRLAVEERQGRAPSPVEHALEDGHGFFGRSQ
jgi:hypothetical protein